MREPDTIVIGAGTVGAAIAYGLARQGQRVLVLDGGDTDFRAARANFGLVWVQGKGRGMPAYQRLTRQSSDLWPGFLEELSEASGGMKIDYERRGGLALTFGENGHQHRADLVAQLERERIADQGSAAGPSDLEMISRPELETLLPELRLGATVSGASFCSRDGHVNPLHLLAALHAGFLRLGGALQGNTRVETIRSESGGFVVTAGQGSWRAARVVIAAGIAGAALGRQVGLDVPIFPQRGQVLVTQRVAPVLPYPCSGLRQTADGTIMIGATKEDVGEDVSTSVRASGWLARKTVDISPDLGRLQLVRHWAGLRTLSPDGCPIYAQSPEWPGVFVVSCHSGVTLAAVHAAVLAPHIAAGALPSEFGPFHHRRFNVQAAR
ncbi:NAD(P)/FAD-dependent oxidoreductase [Pseudotabrizicola alkalilacus]|uniref:NAD(P)/FAD-dependent oxidoreductase n=1 Tax=Pseudotabrizicola alkalilacus TaxID=2305252 RepID=UPI0018F11DF1|nr:FAD-dependent oxidoreductase [Pseudotabrizicola alkalilacus]